MAGISNCAPCNRDPGFLEFRGPSASAIASAKAGAVGGSVKNCQKGKSCSATCIARNEDCLVELSPEIQNELRRMANFIIEKRAKAGNPLAAGSEEDIAIGKAVGDVGSKLTEKGTYQRGTKSKPRETEERTFGASKREQNQYVRAKEIAGLKARRDQIGDAQNQAELMKAWQKEVNGRGVNLAQKDLELVFDSLPQAARTQLSNSGNPGTGKKKWYGVDKDGNEVTNKTSGTRERGIAVLKMYIQQAGTDAYQNNGKMFSPADLDVEHVKPVSKGGLDHPSNWVLARSGAQRKRAEEHLGDWIDSLPDPNNKAAMANYMDRERQTRAAKRAIKGLSREAYENRKNMTDEEWYNIPAKKRMAVSELKGGEKTKLPRREAIGEYMFLSDKGKDGFIAGASLIDPRKGASGGDDGSRSGRIPAPNGWKNAYVMFRKDHSSAQAESFRREISDEWNKFARDKQITAEQATSNIKNLFKQNLTPNQFKLVSKDIDDGTKSMLGSSAVIAANSQIKSAGGSAAPAKSGKAMSQQEAEAALDALLADL
jgi:hypothetical protein